MTLFTFTTSTWYLTASNSAAETVNVRLLSEVDKDGSIEVAAENALLPLKK